MNETKTNRNQHYRSHQTQSSSSGSDEELTSKIEHFQIRGKQSRGSRGLFQSSSGKAKKTWSRHSSSSDDEYGNDTQTISAFSDFYKSTRSGKSEAPVDMGATSITEIDTQYDRDPQAIRDRKLKSQRPGRAADDSQGVPFYRGHIQTDDAMKQRYGPQRAPQNIRSTTRWDYAPDICKDYKETGTCGFGDSCKFLHDRSDFKFGWQLDAEYESGQYGGDMDTEDFEIERYEMENEDFPDLCNVCREPFRDPVKAACDHYFCEKCFKQAVAKKKKCPVCSVTLTGFAKVAKIPELKNRGASQFAVT